jgi:5-formyltetrahydrofolate cyclo-ligase
MNLTPSYRRQSIRQSRQQLSPDQQRQHFVQAFQHFKANWSLISQRDNPDKKAIFLGFIATDGELATTELLSWVLAQPHWQLALPVLGEKPGEMHCVLWDGHSSLQPNRWGILEPCVNEVQVRIAIEEVSCVLMPLVAFDRQGHRLGMGGGFYDRLLAGLANLPVDQRPWLLGWAHSLQQVDVIEPEPWDVALDACITEDGYQLFTSSREHLAL